MVELLIELLSEGCGGGLVQFLQKNSQTDDDSVNGRSVWEEKFSSG